MKQPNATDFEESVLGVVLTVSGSLDGIADLLHPEAFYDERHKKIWTVILSLYSENKPIDILSVNKRLKETGMAESVGGAVYLTELSSKFSSIGNLDYHVRILQEQYLKRELIKISHNTIKSCLDDSSDVFDLYGKAISQTENVLSGVLRFDAQVIGNISRETIAESRKVAVSGQKSGVTTGFRNLDNFLNGWQRTDLVILAGRPSMGKSVCALSFALNPALKENIPTAIFSLEMSKEQLVGRSQSSLSYLESSKIIKKMLSLSEIDLMEQRCSILNQAPVYIDDTPSLSLLELKGKARKLVKDKGVKLIIIDYLQLMTVDTKKNTNREQEVSQISKGLKALAKELNIPIIALSQLNRMVEGRSDKRPNLSDLRESGSIEQDADMVIFTYRPEYYELQTYEMGGETLNTEGLMVLIVAKHRAGSLGELRLGFNGELTKIENYDTFISNRRESQRQPLVEQRDKAENFTGGEDVPF